MESWEPRDSWEPAESSSVWVVHDRVEGRLRLRIPDLRNNLALAHALESILSSCDGVSRVLVNPFTGGVLIFHGGGVASGELVERLERAIDRFWNRLDARTLLLARAMTAKRAAPGSHSRPRALAEAGGPAWHHLEALQILERFGGSRTLGLAGPRVNECRALFGANRLARAEPETGWDLFANQFRNPAVAILVGSAALSMATGGASEALVLGVVILGNAYVGYRMEYQANRSLSLLARMASSDVLVIRDGERRVLPAEELVAGDLLLLSSGVSVPADARILECEDLSVDESALTGESVPVTKSAETLPFAEIPLTDRRNMLYRGTLVITGRCVAIAVAVGPRTELGRIQSLISEIEVPRTHLQAQLNALTGHLLMISLATAAGVFAVGILRGRSGLEMTNLGISLIISAIPEGLTTVATTALAQAALSVRRDNVLVRKLDSIEALGSMQVLCVDKTGTLTLNRMKVASIFDGDRWLEVEERGIFEPETGHPVTLKDEPGLRSLLEVAVLCNDSCRDWGEKDAWSGSATERALVELADEVGLDVLELRAAFPRVRTQLRTNSYRIMSTLHERPEGRRFLAVKGSPDEVLELCEWFWKDGKRCLITPLDRARFTEANRAMSERALRVLGIASLEEGIEEDRLHSNRGLTWLGLTGMRDQLREGMRELLASLRGAGIQIKMITGDQGATAAAIGRELDFGGGEPLRIMDGDTWERLSRDQKTDCAARYSIFARINPSQKLEIVEALKASGKVVAMVGDGINDAAALHIADVGISMGRNGTQVSREVANVVLMDDDLRNLLPAIRAGRANHDNINKAVNFLLATNLSETMILGGSVILGFDSPLSALQLLWINLITDVFPALALAMDPPADDILTHPPPSRDEELVTGEDFRCLVAEASGMAAVNLVAYGFGFFRYGPGPRARTLAFMNLNTSQVLHTVSASTRGRLGRKGLIAAADNPYVTLSVGAGFALEGVALWVPFARTLLGNAWLGLADYGVGGALALVNFAANQAAIRATRQPRSRRGTGSEVPGGCIKP